jgi:hypothetical protein
LPALKEPSLRPPARGHLFDPGGPRTLDDLVTDLLADGCGGRPTTCPVCEEPALSPSPGAGFVCGACGSRLE